MDLKNQFYTNSRVIDCPFCNLRFSTSDGTIPAHDCKPKVEEIKEREFQIIKKPSIEAQKCLNQWRHQYDIEIISAQGFSDSDRIIITLWRTPK